MPVVTHHSDGRDSHRMTVAGRAVRLRLHCHSGAGQALGAVSAVSLGGKVGAQADVVPDGDWLTIAFDFAGVAADAYLGFTISGDGAHPPPKRFVRARDGVAEAWLVDGDQRVYSAPHRVDPAAVIRRGRKTYLSVDGLAGPLGLTCEYGADENVFDAAAASTAMGTATGTAAILTIRRGRDRFTVDVESNRVGQNLTASMLREHADTVFADVDGFAHDGGYALSVGSIRRLFQVGVLVGSSAVYILPRQFTAYDTLQRVDDPARVGFSRAGLDAIDRYVAAQADRGGPSLAISIVKDGAIVKQSAYGYAKRYDTPLVGGALQPARLLPRDSWEPATVDTMYDLASNTKMYVTNYALQRLVSEGVLDLDRTLQSFPGWQDYTDAATQYTGDWVVGGRGGIARAYTGKSTITVADLLHHTAGELPDPQYPNAQVAGGLYYQSTDIRDRSGIIDVICRTPLVAGPHTEFRYSDLDYMILGLLVEQLTGQRLDAYLQEHFYGPLGLDHTTFTPLLHGFTRQQAAATELNGNTRDGHVSFGPLPDGTPAQIRHNTLQGEVHDEKGYYSMAGVSGHAGLFSTVGDLAVLTQLMLNGGLYNGRQYFTQEVAEQFTTPYALDPADVDSSTIGLGWRVQSATSDGYRYFNVGPSRNSYGHAGWTGTLTIIDPAYNMTITILTNMPHSPVVDPPNGFAASRYPIAELTPVVARVYSALRADVE
ncbi:MAG: penicillin binding protein PBP4B [Microbacteriaceae bacterium]|nr:MAG: penicillin binding protein PBP4B [Microbacteriaceae bacterium]